MSQVNREVPPIWTTGWTDVLNTGTWRSAIPVHRKRPSPCRSACPVEGEIPVWVQLAREERHREAWLTLALNNPMPAVTGRICHHPCEGECNRGRYDGAVSINALEQFLGDLALEQGWTLPEPQTGPEQRVAGLEQRVAVIGGGPAGLSCAYQLRLRGYRVTVFEARPELGGVLRYGIPRYRLPEAVLAGEIRRLLALGIEVSLNRQVTAADLKELEEEYAAVFLAIGAGKAKLLPQFPAGDARVFDGLNFLDAVNTGSSPRLGRQVVVIGGGSVAMDAARSARRLGSQVKVLALESKGSLPAQADEVREALEEGVLLYDGAMVQEIGGEGERLSLACCKVVLDTGAPQGVLRPVALPGTGFALEADNIILAIGQDPDLSGWDEKLGRDKELLAVDFRGMTSRRGVFAGGDAASYERYVSAAIGQGKKAAAGIAAFLSGEVWSEEPAITAGEVSFAEVNTFYFPVLPRQERETLPVEARLGNFAEVKGGYGRAEAQLQAERCFSCGQCLECDNCYYFCPDMAVVKDSSLAEHYRVLDQYCKGCGSCVEECPRGAVVLKEETR